MWDTFMFHAVIKKRGRVPAQDGFIARRIAGPGLASNYFYQVRRQKTLCNFGSNLSFVRVHCYTFD